MTDYHIKSTSDFFRVVQEIKEGKEVSISLNFRYVPDDIEEKIISEGRIEKTYVQYMSYWIPTILQIVEDFPQLLEVDKNE